MLPGSSVGRAIDCTGSMNEVIVTRIERRKYSDRREYIIHAVQKRRKKVRAMAVAYKGGKCERCGYDHCLEALDFHHTDPTQKDFSISSKGYTRSWKRVREELDKCIMICANCHREVHAELAALNRNIGMKSRLSQGTLKLKSYGDPELPLLFVKEGECRDFTPATLT